MENGRYWSTWDSEKKCERFINLITVLLLACGFLSTVTITNSCDLECYQFLGMVLDPDSKSFLDSDFGFFVYTLFCFEIPVIVMSYLAKAIMVSIRIKQQILCSTRYNTELTQKILESTSQKEN